MPSTLSRKVPLAELHCHLGAAVTPAIMWSIAHAQGIKLPTRDYWEFRDLITVHPRRPKSFDGYLQLFHWTELIQSSPIAVERAVYEVVGGAYRKNNITTMELRFNPMKRNRGGEQDLDHIIAAAVRGHGPRDPRVPGQAGPASSASTARSRTSSTRSSRRRRSPGATGASSASTSPAPSRATFRVADYRRLFRRVRQYGLGITVHTGESGPVEEIARVIELLEPDRIGHGVKAAYDPRTMAMLRERGIVLEICPTSNLNTGVVSGWDEFRWIFDQFHRNGVRYAISTDGPEMLKTYIRDELATLGRLGILSLEQQEQIAATSLAASFVPNVSDVPLAVRRAGPARDRGARRGLAAGPRRGRAVRRRADPVLAAPVAARDVVLAARPRRPARAANRSSSALARRRADRLGDLQHGAVVLDQPEPAAVDPGLARGSRARPGAGASSRTRSSSGASSGRAASSSARSRASAWRRRAANTSSTSASPPTSRIAASRPVARPS